MEDDKKQQKKEVRRQKKLLIQQYNEMIDAEEEHRKEEKHAPEDVYVSLQHINKVYDNYVQAVFDFNLDINQHDFVVFVGPSGCGKSTTIRMIAGLETITTGDLYIDGEYCNDKTPKDRDIAMVFQNYALYPHMTVYQNMAFGLQSRNYSKEEIDERVRKAAETLEITEYLDRLPKQLSGGQMQRVALGRAIVREAKVFLMDEPLSNLDAKLRVSMRSEIIKLHRRINATTIYVTHDQTEAMTMATKIVVMNNGRIQQVGTPTEVYDNPANTFVATFIGSPPMNLITCRYSKGTLSFNGGFFIKLSKEQIKKHDDFYKEQIARVEQLLEEKDYEKPDQEALFTLAKKETRKEKRERKKQNQLVKVKIKTPEEKKQELEEELEAYKFSLKNPHEVRFGIRPEDIYPCDEIIGEINSSDKFSCVISLSELLGSEYQIHLDWCDADVVVSCRANEVYEANSEKEFVLDLNKFHLFDSNNGLVVL